MSPSYPSYSGYKLLGAIGGHGNGEVGLLVSPNGWVFNSSNVTKTFTGVAFYLIYIK